MKIRRSIIGAFVIAAILIVVMLWFEKKQPDMMPPVPSPTTNVASSAAAAAPAPSTPMASGGTISSANPPSAALPEDRIALLKKILQANDSPIVFYGQLKDQSGNVVSGAAVNFAIQYENPDAKGVRYGQVMSDDNGFFTISGKGANLTLTPKKTGYAMATMETSFRYSQISPGYFIPDASNPTIIKMWKLQGAEPLLSINQRYKFHYTDVPIHFDLLAGQMVPDGGDIQIAMSRSLGVVSGRNRQDWSVEVKAVDGGLMESGNQEKVTFAAPETGYQPEDNFILSTNAPNKWFGGFERMFFVKSRNGQIYSKINFAIAINQHPDDFVWVEFHGVANTNSSRNWEGDDNTMKTAGQ